MLYRLVGKADEQVDTILLKTAEEWGRDGASRYNRLILAALAATAADPATPGSRPVHGFNGLWSYHLRLARRLVSPEHRVGEPRHMALYRQAIDGTVEILGFVHERQQLGLAARRAKTDADD